MRADHPAAGPGLLRAAFAQRLHKVGKTVPVIDKRSHTGGNVRTEEAEAASLLYSRMKSQSPVSYLSFMEKKT